jgi:uncharacterized protein YndB with AHSA1/START domain
VTKLGTITTRGDTCAVRFERLYDATPQELWRALTDPEQLRGWLADVSRDVVAPGAEWEVRFGGEDHAGHWRIREAEEDRVLELDWRWAEEPESVLRFEIVPQPTGGTVLILDHRLLASETASGYGAGWQSHLEALELLLAGEPSGGADVWRSRYEALRPLYEERAAAV